MNEKEVAEIRRRYRLDKNNITGIHGCCVNEKHEIVSRFSQSISLMAEGEQEKLWGILRKTLSGGIGKNLMDMEFSTQQAAYGEEHKLLMSLRDTELEEGCLETFYERVIQSVNLDGSYLILMVHDTYDVPFYSSDGEHREEEDSEVFRYVLCAICPVKLTKPALNYHVHENEFCTSPVDWVVAPPELGFVFPAFNERSADIYHALFYSRNISNPHEEFIKTVFQCEPPMPASLQKETFQNVLADSLGEECNYEVVQALDEQTREIIAEHKESGEPESPVITKQEVTQVLEECGISEARITAFSEEYDSAFGKDAELNPKNLIEKSRFEVLTPDVTIHVNPERSDLVDTRIIDGVRYILVRADSGVEVNGISVHFMNGSV